jgi:putative DNA primase/helicase
MISDFHSILIEEEGAGILAWAVDGAVKFNALDCNISDVKPEAVIRASSEYRSSEDWIAGFIGECCTDGDTKNETVFVRHNDLYRVYQNWAKTNGEYVRSSASFGKSLQSAGWRANAKWYDPDRKTTTKIWYGYELIDGGRTFSIVQGGTQTRKAQ